MNKITFVTGNAGKLAEARTKLGPLGFEVVQDREGYPEIQHETIEEVAQDGAKFVGERIEGNFFLEDAGLFVDALNGFPGVYSAYVYKTLGCEGILQLLKDLPEEKRGARFEAVIAYRDGDKTLLFKGYCPGKITSSKKGERGFGYDPIFVPDGADIAFAQMSREEKNSYSHRGRALDQFTRYLKNSL